ncbi:Hypothetical protein PBC10988_34090 [Planctomycetales bacterium 10988]|nr:Hypothetical protein PBC10988_34090 [Planctomycetales bacterium 10988]
MFRFFLMLALSLAPLQSRSAFAFAEIESDPISTWGRLESARPQAEPNPSLPLPGFLPKQLQLPVEISVEPSASDEGEAEAPNNTKSIEVAEPVEIVEVEESTAAAPAEQTKQETKQQTKQAPSLDPMLLLQMQRASSERTRSHSLLPAPAFAIPHAEMPSLSTALSGDDVKPIPGPVQVEKQAEVLILWKHPRQTMPNGNPALPATVSQQVADPQAIAPQIPFRYSLSGTTILPELTLFKQRPITPRSTIQAIEPIALPETSPAKVSAPLVETSPEKSSEELETSPAAESLLEEMVEIEEIPEMEQAPVIEVVELPEMATVEKEEASRDEPAMEEIQSTPKTMEPAEAPQVVEVDLDDPSLYEFELIAELPQATPSKQEPVTEIPVKRVTPVVVSTDPVQEELPQESMMTVSEMTPSYYENEFFEEIPVEAMVGQEEIAEVEEIEDTPAPMEVAQAEPIEEVEEKQEDTVYQSEMFQGFAFEEITDEPQAEEVSEPAVLPEVETNQAVEIADSLPFEEIKEETPQAMPVAEPQAEPKVAFQKPAYLDESGMLSEDMVAFEPIVTDPELAWLEAIQGQIESFLKVEQAKDGVAEALGQNAAPVSLSVSLLRTPFAPEIAGEVASQLFPYSVGYQPLPEIQIVVPKAKRLEIAWELPSREALWETYLPGSGVELSWVAREVGHVSRLRVLWELAVLREEQINLARGDYQHSSEEHGETIRR